MSSRLRHDDPIAEAADRVAALLAADDDAGTPKKVWHRKALGGLTHKQAVETASPLRRTPLRMNVTLAARATEHARSLGMSRESWVRHLMAVELVRVYGDDYDTLTGPFTRTAPRTRPGPRSMGPLS